MIGVFYVVFTFSPSFSIGCHDSHISYACLYIHYVARYPWAMVRGNGAKITSFLFVVAFAVDFLLHPDSIGHALGRSEYISCYTAALSWNS